jgi:hypothetical protein
MPEDIPAEERIPALLAEWDAVKHLPDAKAAHKAIAAELERLGAAPPSDDEPADDTTLETAEPEPPETTAQPKTRQTKT